MHFPGVRYRDIKSDSVTIVRVDVCADHFLSWGSADKDLGGLSQDCLKQTCSFACTCFCKTMQVLIESRHLLQQNNTL